jgi:cytoskeletal protein CcmA (bactofilin family)
LGPCSEIYTYPPDTTIGFGVEVNGELEFAKLLRINGRFKGNLSIAGNDLTRYHKSDMMGNIIIGEHGKFVGNIGDSCLIKCMVVEGGEVVGNIQVDELLLLNHSKITGKITCKHCCIGPEVSINSAGESVNIQPLAPELIDEFEQIVTSSQTSPAIEKGPPPASSSSSSTAAAVPRAPQRKTFQDRKVRGEDAFH